MHSTLLDMVRQSFSTVSAIGGRVCSSLSNIRGEGFRSMLIGGERMWQCEGSRDEVFSISSRRRRSLLSSVRNPWTSGFLFSFPKMKLHSYDSVRHYRRD
ncbi:hypothetical protein BRADI_1g23726v3 [Brachypodium distachyon]|uniref:Uncharacterized protein n=1 Tax=Brachypodium distachyon TaxID=15368 RepID=A0A2K2DKT8_BRADI|nr:hypothetical protein BRADI_1g23726v3 [Brachypodium distachyon]